MFAQGARVRRAPRPSRLRALPPLAAACESCFNPSVLEEDGPSGLEEDGPSGLEEDGPSGSEEDGPSGSEEEDA